MTHESLTGAVVTRELRRTFGMIATGATVVTVRSADGVPHGAAASAFTAVSLDPPLAQVTLPRTSRAARYLEGAMFAINVLSTEQMDAALHFAGEVPDAEPEWTLNGIVPVLSRNAATLECRPWNIYDGGDHVIVVGEVIGLDFSGRKPLLLFGGEFHTVGSRIGGGRWDRSGEALEAGWFAGSSSFMPLGVPKPH
jgi:flavin reductase (DIM6/NTAB) family NADH-FMN oxidoreductase RutF